MYKKSLVSSIIITILNIFPTLYCGYLNLQMKFEGPEAIGLLAIIPYTFMILPIILALLIPGLVLSIRAIKSDSTKIKATAIVFTVLNAIIALICLIIVLRLTPAFLG